MKKMMMVAAMAMMTAVASAVTVKWTADLQGNGKSGGWCGVAILSGAYNPTTVDGLPALSTLVSVSGRTATWEGGDNVGFIAFANTNVSQPWSGNTHGAVASGSEGGYGPLWADDNGTFTTNPTGEDGRDAGVKYHGSFTLDDSATAFTLILFNDYNGSYTVATYEIPTDLDLSKEQDLGVIEWTKTSTVNETVVLPEPTALALLALGVAGLTLKRKVK